MRKIILVMELYSINMLREPIPNFNHHDGIGLKRSIFCRPTKTLWDT